VAFSALTGTSGSDPAMLTHAYSAEARLEERLAVLPVRISPGQTVVTTICLSPARRQAVQYPSMANLFLRAQ